jgi:hypothetical protein
VVEVRVIEIEKIGKGAEKEPQKREEMNGEIRY